MKISTEKLPLDIIILLVWSILIIPIIFFDINRLLQIFIGLPIILFIPGYILSLILFPTKKLDEGIDNIDRFVYSFALSLAIIPIIGLILNYTAWGLELYTILFSLELFIFIGSILAIYRRHKTPQMNRFIITFNLTYPNDKDTIDKILTVILVILIISSIVISFYVITNPKEGRPFTEFYILNSEGLISDYPTSLGYDETATVKIGIANHEQATKKYTIEVWLVNLTTTYDEITKKNKTDIKHMWYKYKTSVELNHIPADINKPWTSQWENDYTFSISREGDFRLFFLLFTTETQEYQINNDYRDIAKQKIEDAYSITNFSISVPFYPWISNIQAYPNTTLQNNQIKLSCSIHDADVINNVTLHILYPDNVLHVFDITKNKIGNDYQYIHIYRTAGKYRYYISADDITGNFTTSSVYEFNITDIPIISNLSASSNSTLKNSFINITCLIYDADGLENVSIIILYPDKHIENISIINNTIDNQYYFNQTYGIIGKYSYYIWVKDLIEYTNISDIKQFYVI